jgi:hypothetical protein
VPVTDSAEHIEKSTFLGILSDPISDFRIEHKGLKILARELLVRGYTPIACAGSAVVLRRNAVEAVACPALGP